MKVKDIEGSPEEIEALFQKSGSDLTNYLNVLPVRRKIKGTWLWLVTILFILCAIGVSSGFYVGFRNAAVICLLTLFGLGLWIIYQNNSSNLRCLIIPTVFGALIILVSLNVYGTPEKLMKQISDEALSKVRNTEDSLNK